MRIFFQYTACLCWLVMSNTAVFSQTDKAAQFWNEYAFTRDLGEKWVAEADFGLTSSSVPNENTIFYGIIQVYFRGWVHYYPADRWKLSVFYAYYFNENVPELNQNQAPEYRFALQATYNLLKQRRMNINLRARFEDRNIENEYSVFEAVERFRFQGRAVYPINGRKIKENVFFVFVSDELFFKTRSEISGNEFFDRNRLTIGFGYAVTNTLQLEISYANEFLPRASTDKVYNALQVNVMFDNLFSNVFKRKKTAVDDGKETGGGM